MGVGSSPLVHHSAQDVPAHCQVRAEKGREAHLPRTLRLHVKTKLRGGPIYHETCGILDLSQEDLGHLPQHKHVGFSFCLIFNEITDFLFNRIDFLLDHKLLPVQLTWLHLMYGKMFSLA